jgi:hypothetical protein
MPATPLSLIIAYARAGASAFAWEQFEASGYDRMTDDAAALSVRGRLLKDRALSHEGAERRRLYGEASRAYRSAAAVSGATYPLINAGTLSRLAGDEARARSLATEVLDRIEQDPAEPETPYYAAATRAEALLLLDREPEARTALAEAVALAPRAWEDHASTLRQFALILDAQGRNSDWLNAYRPPRSLHFGGHMSFDPKVVRREHLDEKIAAVLHEENVGFGYGALAAGADIIIAEALLERGAELHPVLPGGPESFASVSVDPFGKAWRKRFDAVLARAETVREVRPLGMAPDKMTIGLADEIAMGVAVMNARRLESRALQLLVLDRAPSASADRETANGYARWAEAGWRQRIITAPREALPAGPPPPLPTRPHARMALLAIGLGPAPELFQGRLADLAELLGQAPQSSVQPYLAGEQVVLAYDGTVEAARAALALRQATAGATAFGVGGHYGIVDPLDDPLSGQMRLVGEPAQLAAAAAASAPPGSICVTEDFAAALAASNVGDVCSELIGELEARDGRAPVALYALKPRPSPLPGDEEH